jgi:hypothetical protein
MDRDRPGTEGRAEDSKEYSSAQVSAQKTGANLGHQADEAGIQRAFDTARLDERTVAANSYRCENLW